MKSETGPDAKGNLPNCLGPACNGSTRAPILLGTSVDTYKGDAMEAYVLIYNSCLHYIVKAQNVSFTYSCIYVCRYN